jgi:hypothetical protein
VPDVIDAGRVAYEGESGDYFPGVTDAAPSKPTPRLQGRRHSIGGGVEDGPVLMVGDEMALLEGGQLPSKRQRLDDG